MADYSRMTVVALKDVLRERGLGLAGKKADLIERLKANDAENDGSKEETGEELTAVENNQEVVEKKDDEPGETTPAVEQPAQDNQDQGIANAGSEAQEESGEQAIASAPVVEDMVVEEPRGAQDEATKNQSIDEAPAAIEEQTKDLAAVPVESEKEEQDNVEANPESSLAAPQVPQSTLDEQSKDIADISEEKKDGLQEQKDAAAMPAPALSSSQMPQPSIETQQPSTELEGDKMDTEPDVVTRIITASSANTQEVLEDSKKRKRRSQSPPISTAEVALKKAKAVDGSPRATVVENGKAVLPSEDAMQIDAPESKEGEIKQESRPASDNRFRDLLPPQETSQPAETQIEERATAPSRHVPTNYLYISNLMRPLQPSALKAHVQGLAQSGSGEKFGEGEVEGLFFLETTRRYALISFSSNQAASRVRSNLHDRIWPDESNRKALFVDFLNEDLAKELIQIEEENASKPRLERKRYEILYLEKDNEIVAEIHDADSHTAREYHTSQEPTTSSRRKQSLPQSKLPLAPQDQPGKNFKPLDDLFSFTTIKPRLYYLPVPKDLAEKRLDILARETSRDTDIRAGDEKKRYTFEDDRIVDKGPEFGFGRGGAGRGRGGYRGRGRGYGGHDGGSYGSHGGGYGGGGYRSGAGVGYRDRERDRW